MTNQTRDGQGLPDDQAQEVLTELLGLCRGAATECLHYGSEDPGFTSFKNEARLTGVRLVKASLDIVAAMRGPKAEFQHRIVVERTQGDPPPPQKTPKTIHSGNGGEEHNNG